MYDEIENVTVQYKILDFVAVGLCLLSSDWMVLFWNRYLEEYTKISKEEIVGTSLFTHFHHLNPQPFESYRNQVFEQKREVNFSVSSHQWQTQPCPQMTEKPLLVQVCITPVSGITGAECYALLTLQNSIPPISNNFDSTSTEFGDQQVEFQQLIDRLSHDLQEPLRMVINCSQLLTQRYSGQLDSTADKMIHFAVDGASRMQQMLDGLLVYSRLKTHSQPPEAINAQICLERAIINLQSLILKTEAQIQASNLPTVIANPQQLTQLFTILIENAIQYCHEQPPQVEITVQSIGQIWVFSVRDNGIGIDRKYHQDIFELFRRLHPRQDYPGIGMGLAIAKRIVELHQGCIWVDSYAQQGSIFYFTLPRPDSTNPLLTPSEKS